MTGNQPDPRPVAEEVAQLRAQLADLQQTVAAIRDGEVDAVVVGGPQGEQLYTQISADRPYRVIVEEMGDGALTVSERGVVLYANERMAKLLGRRREDLLGLDLAALVDRGGSAVLADLLTAAPGTTRRAELDLGPEDVPGVPVLASVTGLEIEGVVVRCLIAADLTDQRRAAAAVDQARQELLRQTVRLEEEHRLKDTLQRAVLPATLPAVPGLRLAARYLPADGPSLVGGDWYDAFTLPDGSVAVAVGDVVGHDLDAAATMGQMRNALRAYAYADGPPAGVLDRLDRLTGGLPDGGLATVVLGRMDVANRTLRWASAGHPAPLLIGPRGARLLPAPAGAMIGAQVGTTFVDESTPIEPGEVLVLYTDGLIERRDRDLDAGSAALLEAAADLAGRAPEQVCAALVERMVPGRTNEDDVCLLALELPSALGGDGQSAA